MRLALFRLYYHFDRNNPLANDKINSFKRFYNISVYGKFPEGFQSVQFNLQRLGAS